MKFSNPSFQLKIKVKVGI